VVEEDARKLDCRNWLSAVQDGSGCSICLRRPRTI
jgi:hypothetical protein